MWMMLAHAALPSAFVLKPVPAKALGVFGPNKSSAFHRWVTFTEGFSAQLVLAELATAPTGSLIFDPFAGTGTTPLVAAQLGHEATYAEVNPYLSEAAETKVIAATATTTDCVEAVRTLLAVLEEGPSPAAVQDHPLLAANVARDFFRPEIAAELVAWFERFEALPDDLARRLGRLAVATSTVPVSNMKRAVDLRRRTTQELARAQPNVGLEIRRRITAFVEDLERGIVASGTARRVSGDARSLPSGFGDIDLTVTSPPYLNGTNYFRNTKLELLLLRLIQSEADLQPLRTRAITAGINNVSKRIAEPVEINEVERVATALDEVAYDSRIPRMVRAYFADMQQVLAELHRASRSGARLVVDIGDSRFAGVHVDTPELLAGVAEGVGWSRRRTEIIRPRVAKDGGALCQKLLYLCST